VVAVLMMLMKNLRGGLSEGDGSVAPPPAGARPATASHAPKATKHKVQSPAARIAGGCSKRARGANQGRIRGLGTTAPKQPFFQRAHKEASAGAIV
jgi:hypothetical protein